MGLFDKLFKQKTEEKKQEVQTPVKEEPLSPGEDLLRFYREQGIALTEKEKKELSLDEESIKKEKTFAQWQTESEPIAVLYYDNMAKLEELWSKLYKSGDYTGELSVRIEALCRENINQFLEMRRIDKKYGEYTPLRVPAFSRITLLYERRKDYQSCLDACEEALQYDITNEDIAKRRDRVRAKLVKKKQ